MKIFGWMHRKFHRNVDYDMVSPKTDLHPLAEEVRKAPTLDTKPLLLHQGHVALIDALDEWDDSILAIGTFGLDQFPMFEVEYSEPGTEESESPAVEAWAEEVEEVFVTSNDAEGAVPEETAVKSSGGGAASVVSTAAEEINVVVEYSKKKGERTTLADLFSAEADAGKCNAKEVKIGMEKEKEKEKMKKRERTAKGVRKLAKKLVPWKGEDSPPTAKLHRLVTKILKRKIHPELDRGVHGAVRDNMSALKTEPAIGKHVELIGMNGLRE